MTPLPDDISVCMSYPRRTFTLLLAIAAVLPIQAQRLELELVSGWRFIRRDVAADAATGGWDAVSIPHTWNAFDGQDRKTPGATPRANERTSDYFRGTAWYARDMDVPRDWQGKRVFLLFEAASQRANVFLNGERLGEHRGSFTAFCFEITAKVRFGARNDLRVQLDNSLVKAIPPLAGDFNVNGGIYRPVRLIVTDQTCISPLESASPGVFVTVRSLEGDGAVIDVKTLVSNALASPSSVDVVTEIKDASGSVVATTRTPLQFAPGVQQTVSQNLRLSKPRLWQGRRDPYLYSVTVRLVREGRPADEVVQPLGVRTVALTAGGFLLNGKPYPVYGVCRHQDRQDKAWALGAEDDEQDVRLILEMGATAVRLAHYPQGERFHQLCDRAGLLLWEEVPFVNEVPYPDEPLDVPSEDTRSFNATLDSEMREMVLQRYNHPSVAWWGLFNELRPGAMNQAAMPEVARLNAIAHELDATRPTVGASDKVGNPTNAIPDAMGYNVYPGWYTGNGDPGELAKLIDERFADRRNLRVALSEYGAGGNPLQHATDGLTKPKANEGPFHPEEWQALMHERDWAQIKANPKLWGTFVWVMFDFASDGRSEGGVPGRNDKGLVTYDRSVTKDAYHFYRANWSETPMVHIASRRASTRQAAVTDVKVYSNAGEVELLVNGAAVGSAKPDDLRIVRWSAVKLQPGLNTIVARAVVAGGELRDECVWAVEPSAPPAAR